MWSRQLLMTAAVPVYPGEQLGPCQRRCAAQLQQLTRRLVELCELTAVTAAAADSARREPAAGPKQTADAAVDAREQPGRIPPLPDLVQSCTAADTAGSRQQHQQQQASEQQQQQQQRQLQQQHPQQRRKDREAVDLLAPMWPSAVSAQVTAAPAGPAAPSDTALQVGRSLRHCADQLHSSRRKRRPAPPPSPLRHTDRTVSSSAVLLSVSALLLVWFCHRR